MASVQLQKPVEIPQAQAHTVPLPAIHTHSKPSEQQASTETSQKCEEKHAGSNMVEGVKELLHIEQSSKKTEHVEHQSLNHSSLNHVEKSSACVKEREIGGIIPEKKKKDKKEKEKKEKDKKEKDKHAKNTEDGQGTTTCKSPKTHDKKEKKKIKNKNKDDDSSNSDDDARSKAKKLDKEKKKHK